MRRIGAEALIKVRVYVTQYNNNPRKRVKIILYIIV